MLYGEREREEKSLAHSLPHLFLMLYSGSGTPAAAVRLQQAVSDATISSPSISSEKDCIKFNFFSFSVRGKTLHSVKTFSSFLQI